MYRSDSTANSEDGRLQKMCVFFSLVFSAKTFVMLDICCIDKLQYACLVSVFSGNNNYLFSFSWDAHMNLCMLDLESGTVYKIMGGEICRNLFIVKLETGSKEYNDIKNCK